MELVIQGMKPMFISLHCMRPLIPLLNSTAGTVEFIGMQSDTPVECVVQRTPPGLRHEFVRRTLVRRTNHVASRKSLIPRLPRALARAGELGLGHGSTKSDSFSHTRGASSEKSLPPGRDRTQGVLVQESQPAGMPAAEASAYSTTHLGNISIADISKACGRTFEPPPSPQPNKFASMHMHANSPYRSMHMHTHTHTHTHRHKHIHTHGHV
jgi:hypothetical protein